MSGGPAVNTTYGASRWTMVAGSNVQGLYVAQKVAGHRCSDRRTGAQYLPDLYADSNDQESETAKPGRQVRTSGAEHLCCRGS